MSNLFDFLTDLAINPEKQEVFGRTPQLMMQAAGLSEMEQTALASREGAKVSAAFVDQLEMRGQRVIMGSTFSDPGPDPLPDPDPIPEPSSED